MENKIYLKRQERLKEVLDRNGLDGILITMSKTKRNKEILR